MNGDYNIDHRYGNMATAASNKVKCSKQTVTSRYQEVAKVSRKTYCESALFGVNLGKAEYSGAVSKKYVFNTSFAGKTVARRQLPPLNEEDNNVVISRGANKMLPLPVVHCPENLVSATVDKKIVAHLRKRLHKRLEYRINRIVTAEMKDEPEAEEVAQPEIKPSIPPPVMKEKKRKSISKSEPICVAVVTPPASTMGSARAPSRIEDEAVENEADEQLAKRPPDVSTGEQSDADDEANAETKNEERAEVEGDEGEEEEIEDDGDLSEVDFGIEEDDDEVDYVRPDVSPVPTPSVKRPQTVKRQLPLADTTKQTLQGDMKIKYTPPSKVIKIFINSSLTDSIVERTALIERVYPSLREHYLTFGYELQFLDLQWGMRHLVDDTHSVNELSAQLVKDCMDAKRGLAFITLLAEKYGEVVLPPTIPVDEMEPLMTAITLEWQTYMDAVEASKSDSDAGNDVSAGDDVSASASDAMMSRRRTLTESFLKNNLSSEGAGKPGFRRAVGKLGKQAKVVKLLKRDYGTIDCPDPNLVRTWYTLDSNTVPPVYRLQKISSQYKDILRADHTKRTQARTAWFATERRLQNMLSYYAKQVFTDDSVLNKYNMSLLEKQLEKCLAENGDLNERCIWFKRDIDDMHANLGDVTVQDYLDVLPMSPTVNEMLTKPLNSLKDRLANRLREKNIHQYTITWHPEGVTRLEVRGHQVYIDRLCRDFTKHVRERVDSIIRQDALRVDVQSPLFQEVAHHVMFCQQRSNIFHGRKEILQEIKTHIRSNIRKPLIVFGKSGSGRTSVMAKAVREAHKWIQGGAAATLVRMIGVTAESTRIQLLLRSLCLQLCEVFDMKPTEVPHDYKGLFNYFGHGLTQANEQRPIVIFLDALHYLTDENDARKLSWLPKTLPPHAHLIVSTLPDDSHMCLRQLKRDFPPEQNSDMYLEVTDMPVIDASSVLDHWSERDGHTLTVEQHKTLTECFEKCPLPLYLQVIYNESLNWRSYSTAEETRVGNAVKNVATVVFGRMERDFGEALVRRTFGYLTAAKSGISSNEMEDLLSLDESVMDEVTTNLCQPLRRLPTICWLRLLCNMRSYIDETPADECVTLKWSHLQFLQSAEERYLKQRDKAPSYHKALAEYFSDMWSDTSKPHPGNEKGCSRHVTSQPLYREITLESDDLTASKRTSRRFNLRRLNELPYHFFHAQQMADLKEMCLCNFEFAMAKIMAVSLRGFVDDLQMALQSEPADADLRLLSDTLQLSSVALTRDPRQLGSQLIGRLHEVLSSDVPISAGDAIKYFYIHKMFQQAHDSSLPVLVPSSVCLTAPGGILYDLLSGHTAPITAVVGTTDGQRAVTASMDGTLKLWELPSGRVIKTINGVGAGVSQVCLGAANTLVIVSQGNTISVWSMRSGQCMRVVDEYPDPAKMATADNDRLLVAFYHGAHMMRSWDLRGFITTNGAANAAPIRETRITGNGVHRDNSVLVAQKANGSLLLHAFTGADEAFVRHAHTGRLVHTLACGRASCINAVATSKDYYACATRQRKHAEGALAERHVLELFDVSGGKHLRTLRGCAGGDCGGCLLGQLHINQLGSHALALCASHSADSSEFSVWNLETEEHRHVAQHPAVVPFAACVDLRYCLTAAPGEWSLRIWNLNARINQPAPARRQMGADGLQEIIPMIDNPRYIVSRAANDGPLSVWNVAKGKRALGGGVAVRIERGLVDPSDVTLLRNEFVYILAEKGYAAGAGGAGGGSVFQTLLVYDLRRRRYIRRLRGCYIVPSPAHEYKLLDDERLLGLSENRSHFVIWSTVTSHITQRIRSMFHSMERRLTEDFGQPNTEQEMIVVRDVTAQLRPWERRTETNSAKVRRTKKEEETARQREDERIRERANAIEQYCISGDRSTIVAAYYAHHMCVFDVAKAEHVCTLQDPHSLLLLHVSALTVDGAYLVHPNYDDATRISYVTVWDCRRGCVSRRLRNERDVGAVAVSEKAERVVLGKMDGTLRLWQPGKRRQVKRLRAGRAASGMNFGLGSYIRLVTNEAYAVVFAGDVFIWDLDAAILIATFTPDLAMRCFNVVMDGRVMTFGQPDRPEVVTLRLSDKGDTLRNGVNWFGEIEESSEEEEEVGQENAEVEDTE